MQNFNTKITNSHKIVNKNLKNMVVMQPRPTHILYQCAKFGDDRTSFNAIFDVCDVYFSTISRYIDLKFIRDTYRVVINSLKNIGQRSRSQGRYIAFWRYTHITKTEP